MKNRSAGDGVSHESTCSHLSGFNTEAHVAMIKFCKTWQKACVSCVSRFIGHFLRLEVLPGQIAKHINFQCCSHEKQPNTGCSECLSSVKEVVNQVWHYYEPKRVLDLLTKSAKPKKFRRNPVPPCANVSK